MSTGVLPGELACAGLSSHLPKEHGEDMVGLTIVRATDGPDVAAVAQWDSSVHDSVYLNRITPGTAGWVLWLLTLIGVETAGLLEGALFRIYEGLHNLRHRLLPFLSS